ncbi:MAG: FtsK/SpoIIIE domain-containing protein [Nitrospiraceae bacterium]
MRDLRKATKSWLIQQLHGKMPPTKIEIGYVAAKEIALINGLFQQLKIRALIDHTGVVGSETGNFIRYPLKTYGKVAALESITTDLEVLLSMHRKAETKVTVRTPMLAIETDYPLATRPLMWGDAKLGQLKPFQALLGMDYTSMHPAPAILDYSRKTLAHALIAGTTGSGKSVLVIGLINSLCHSTAPDKLSLIFLDPKFDPDWRVLTGLPHVTMRSEPADCVAAIASVKAELERRKRSSDQRKLILIIDEYADFRGDLDKEERERVEQNLVSITSVGRSLGIHVVLITQKPTIEVVDTVAKSNLSTRICGMVTTAKESEIGMGRGGIGCETLESAGSFYAVIGGGRTQRIQSYLIEGHALETAVEQTAVRWADHEPYQITLLAGLEARETQTSRSPHDMPLEWCVQRVIESELFTDIFPEGGEPHKRAKGLIVELLFGEGTPNRGRENELGRKVFDAIVAR